MQTITQALNGAIKIIAVNHDVELHVHDELFYTAHSMEQMQKALTDSYNFTGLCELYRNECKRLAERLSVTFNDAVPAMGDPSQTVKNMWGVQVNGGLVGSIWFCAHTVPVYQLIIKRKEIGTYPTLADAQQAARQFLFN